MDQTWSGRSSPTTALVVLLGDIDKTGADQPCELLFGAIGAASEVNADVARLTFIDSRAISTLTAARRAAAEAGHRLVLVNPTGACPAVPDTDRRAARPRWRRGLIRPAVMGLLRP